MDLCPGRPPPLPINVEGILLRSVSPTPSPHSTRWNFDEIDLLPDRPPPLPPHSKNTIQTKIGIVLKDGRRGRGRGRGPAGRDRAGGLRGRGAGALGGDPRPLGEGWGAGPQGSPRPRLGRRAGPPLRPRAGARGLPAAWVAAAWGMIRS